MHEDDWIDSDDPLLVLHNLPDLRAAMRRYRMRGGMCSSTVDFPYEYNKHEGVADACRALRQ